VRNFSAVALLACVDVLKELGARVYKRRDNFGREDVDDGVFEAHRAFHRVWKQGDVEVRVRNFVRNSVTAHRTVQTVESNHETFSVLASAEFAELFASTRRYIYALGSLRLWFWARSSLEGLVVLRCRVWAEDAWRDLPEGLALPGYFGGSGEPKGRMVADDVADERTFASLVEAKADADAFWGLSACELKCCGRGKSPRRSSRAKPQAQQ
jgi:hypothetical protein